MSYNTFFNDFIKRFNYNCYNEEFSRCIHRALRSRPNHIYKFLMNLYNQLKLTIHNRYYKNIHYKFLYYNMKVLQNILLLNRHLLPYYYSIELLSIENFGVLTNFKGNYIMTSIMNEGWLYS